MATTITKLAKLAGVSVGSVSLVMNNKDKGQVSAASRKRILALAKKHGYRPNRAARALVQRRAYRVALCHDARLTVWDSLESYGLFNLISDFADGFQSLGYSIELLNIGHLQTNRARGNILLRQPVDGYVFLLMPPARVAPLMRLMRKEDKLAVASGATLGDEYTWTDVDREDAFSRAVRQLVEQGHKRIVLLEVGPTALLDIKREAFLRAMQEYAGVDAKNLIFHTDMRHFLGIYQATTNALETVPDVSAILVTSTYFSDAVIHALQNKGITPGSDCLSLIHI